ncbi:MAG: XdhC family protein [Nocardiopsaceae bacterium]|nr:XdhC family protein [Nocardiopsaceae bacterium]
MSTTRTAAVPRDVRAREDDLRAVRTPFVLATVVRTEKPAGSRPGDRALILPDGTIEGFVGGVCAESTVRSTGLRLLKTGESTLLRIRPEGTSPTVTAPGPQGGADGGAAASNTAGTSVPAGLDSPADVGEPVDSGLVTVANPCLSGGTLEIFMEVVLPPPLVRVFGDSPVAHALVDVGSALGYDVRATDDPHAPIAPDTAAVVVASHGRDEEEVLTAALKAGVPYVGLVASRRRGTAVVADLDLCDGHKQQVRTPVGLNIGARFPAEIALSVFAEMVAVRSAAPADTPGSPERPGPAASTAVAPAEETDPICGMAVVAAPDAISAEYGGRTWYFCAPGCRRTFLRNPGDYARGASEED